VDIEHLLAIGKIVGIHGIKGNLKIVSYSENMTVFKEDMLVFTRDPSGRIQSHEVEWAAPYKRGGLLSLKGVADRDKAESMVGLELLIDRSVLPELENGTFYWFELIGLSVLTADDVTVGRITSIIPTRSNDVYVVRDRDNVETLIPAIQSVVINIDLGKKIMRVNLPEWA
jgi:16S rRNA processing protein RimM